MKQCPSLRLKTLLPCVTLLFWSPNVWSQSLVADLTPPAEKGVASFEIWANQRSNAFSSEFLQTFQAGGMLSREFFDDMLAAHPLVGGMGADVGWSKRFSTRPLAGGPWALTGSIGSEVLVSSLWRRDVLDLVFRGNAHSLGNPLLFTGTGMRVGAFNRLSLGMEHSDTRQRVELSLIQQVAGVEWGVRNGSFWVSEAADSMSLYMNAAGWANLESLPDSNGLVMSNLIPSYGVGVSGSLPLTSDLYPLQFFVDFQDVGILWERSGGVAAGVDTGFVTTGLAVPLQSYFNEDALSDGTLTWQDVVEGTTGIEPDSLYDFTEEAGASPALLPTKIQVRLSWWPTPDVQLRAAARAGSWMPQPEFTAGVGWIPSKRLAFGLDYRSGGWGVPRPAAWLDLRLTSKRMLSIEVDDPLGWMWGSEASSNTYGRGVKVTLRRLPGAGWTRFMGLPSREWKAPPPAKDPSLPQTSSAP